MLEETVAGLDVLLVFFVECVVVVYLGLNLALETLELARHDIY